VAVRCADGGVHLDGDPRPRDCAHFQAKVKPNKGGRRVLFRLRKGQRVSRLRSRHLPPHYCSGIVL
jgi:hypothetical protein